MSEASPDSFAAVSSLIALVTDAKACAKRMSELQAQTELRQGIEREREDKERQFRILLEGVKDCAIYMIDPDGRVSSWNSGAQSIKGYSAGEILDLPLSVFHSA